MNKKVLTISVIILLVLIIVGIYFFIPKNFPIQDCSKINEVDLKIQCYKNLLEETKDVSVCQNIDNSFIKDMCYSDFALVTQDYSACQTYVSFSMQEQCYINIVDSRGSVNFCEELPNRELITVCYSRFAIKDNNSAPCENLKSTPTNKPVYSIFNFDGVYGSEKDYCYYSFGDYGVRMLDKEKVSACENIGNVEIKNTCYTYFAQRFEEDSICNNIEDASMKEECVIIANMPFDY